MILADFENWIFDWSGTLVDDLELVVSATNHVLEHYGKNKLSRSEFRRKFYLPYEGFYRDVLPDISLKELEDHFREGFSRAESRGVTSPPLPFAEELLEKLRDRGSKMFILSSMDKPAFHRHAKELELEHYFEDIYAGILDKRHCILEILGKHQLAPEKTVFLGDMQHDIETAKHGGVASIALLTGYQDSEQLEKMEPSYLFENLSEVVTAFT